MIKLRPHSRYSLIYQDGKTVTFETLDVVPEAKHLIQVKNLETGKVIDLVMLLLVPWIDIVPIMVPAVDGEAKKTK
jgi:hypothetical protein